LSEQQFRRALAISEGDLSVFLARPISAVLLAAAAAVLLGPTLLKRRLVRDERAAV
jgi:putative tricarboxylic transport membrane protein